MNRFPNFIQVLFALLCGAITVAAQNGKLVEQTPYKVPVASYQEWLEGLKTRPSADARDTPFDEQMFRRNNPPELLARLQKGEGVECFKLKYLSDGLQVVGYLVKPKTISGKLPVVIYNRGGHREFGRITLGTILELAGFAEAGFVVLASEYRGNAGGEGTDEAGGADWRVQPVQSLKLAERLQEWRLPYELVIYAEDDHPLTRNQPESRQRIINWFRQHTNLQH